MNGQSAPLHEIEAQAIWGTDDRQLATVARNVSTRYVAIVTDALIGLVLLPFNIHHLGPAAYGLWMLTASLTTYFSVLDLGFGGSIVKFVAYYRAKRDVRGLAGKGGLKLSLRGYDPDADHFVLTRQALGRRVDTKEPERSLLLRKPTMAAHHAGGLKIDVKSADYALLAVQGPKAAAIVQSLTGAKLGLVKYYHFTEATVAGSHFARL